MRTTPCVETDRLAALLQHEASDEDAELVAHLETCPRCCQTLTNLAAERSIREEIASNLPQVVSQAGSALSPALEGVMARLKGESPAPCDDEADLAFLRPPDRPGLLGYLGAYEVLEVIAVGGMGIVLKANDPALGRRVAIKVLAPRLAVSASARRRFLREGRAAAAVCDDHIVTIHGVDETAGLPFLVMKHVVGESLQERLDRLGPLPVAEVVRIGLETAAGLSAAHAHRLIHRDIKPANLLLEGGSGTVIITDFGLARMLDDAQLTQNGVIAGTPAYMAPEQARGEPVDPRADLFSLGSVLYAMCTGIPPFGDSPAVVVLRRLIDDTPQPISSLNPEVPAWLAALIDKLMAKDPDRRCQSAAEVAAWLRDGANRQPGEAAARKGKRRFLVAFGACLLLGSLLLAQIQVGGPMQRPAATETSYDFRGQPLPGDLVVFGDNHYLHVEPEGLRLTLPKDRPGSEAVDIATGFDAFDTTGDFEITTTFEILQAESPPPSYGVGIALTVKKATPLSGSAALCRLVRHNDRQILLWDQALETPALDGKLRIEAGTVPCTDNIGRLRLKRTGSTLYSLWAPGRDGGDFQEIHQCEFGTDGIRRIIVSGVTGRKPCALDARIIDLRISAVRKPEPDIAVSPLGERRSIWLALALAVGVVVAAGISFYRQRRARGQPAAVPAPRPATETEAGGPVLTVCADCGKKLRVRAGLAGKKVKCPHCGRVISVPVTGQDGPSPVS